MKVSTLFVTYTFSKILVESLLDRMLGKHASIWGQVKAKQSARLINWQFHNYTSEKNAIPVKNKTAEATAADCTFVFPSYPGRSSSVQDVMKAIQGK